MRSMSEANCRHSAQPARWAPATRALEWDLADLPFTPSRFSFTIEPQDDLDVEDLGGEGQEKAERESDRPEGDQGGRQDQVGDEHACTPVLYRWRF